MNRLLVDVIILWCKGICKVLLTQEIFGVNDSTLERRNSCSRIELSKLQECHLTKPNTVFHLKDSLSVSTTLEHFLFIENSTFTSFHIGGHEFSKFSLFQIEVFSLKTLKILKYNIFHSFNFDH